MALKLLFYWLFDVGIRQRVLPNCMFYYPNKPVRIYTPDKILGIIERSVPDWICQPKWNGKRVEIDYTGKVKLFSREGRYWEKEQWPWLTELPLDAPWFLDGELLPGKKIYIWDYAVMNGIPQYKEPYKIRLDYLTSRLTPITFINNGQTLSLVQTLPATAYEAFLGRKGDALLEGIVWKKLTATNLWGPYSTSELPSQIKYRFK